MINKQTISDQIYEIIKKQIIENEISPGSKINVEEVQNKYKISKTPLKDALNKLEYEGLVTVKTRSGTYVSTPTKDEIVQVYDLRLAIEWMAIQLSTPHIPEEKLLDLKKRVIEAEKQIFEGNYHPFFDTDVEIHKIIFDYSGNKYIQRVKDMIDTHIHWFRILGATGKQRPYKSSIRHREILDAMLDRDVNLAAELLKTHIKEVKEAVVEDITADYHLRLEQKEI
jgi:GntR family transcriptional regulator, rspAB operon transcriptional repressor